MRHQLIELRSPALRVVVADDLGQSLFVNKSGLQVGLRLHNLSREQHDQHQDHHGLDSFVGEGLRDLGLFRDRHLGFLFGVTANGGFLVVVEELIVVDVIPWVRVAGFLIFLQVLLAALALLSVLNCLLLGNLRLLVEFDNSDEADQPDDSDDSCNSTSSAGFG